MSTSSSSSSSFSYVWNTADLTMRCEIWDDLAPFMGQVQVHSSKTLDSATQKKVAGIAYSIVYGFYRAEPGKSRWSFHKATLNGLGVIKLSIHPSDSLMGKMMGTTIEFPVMAGVAVQEGPSLS